jgi:serralysin
LEAFTAAQKASVVKILAQISSVANITFKEATSGTVGDLTFAKSEQDPNVAGVGNYPSFSWSTSGGKVQSVTKMGVAGDVWIAKDAFWTGLYGTQADLWKEGGVGFGTLFHEIGHALGLKHTFDAGQVSLNGGPLDDNNHSIMSYKEAIDSYVRVNGGSFHNLQPDTLMPFDVEALQYLYGANTTASSGNNTYTWANNPEILQTIWDSGGIDTIDASNQTGNCIINLNAGTFSSIGIHTAVYTGTGGYTGKNNIAIAKNVIIENAKGGSGNDILYANAVNNKLEGGAGNDTYAGYKCGVTTGNDIIRDTGGTDVLEISNAKTEAALKAVKISHTGNDLVLTLSASDSITLESFYTGNSAGSGAIETLTGTNWSISLVGVADQLAAEGAYTTLGDIFA